MPPSPARIPKYRLHRSSGLAVVRFNGIDHYLGKHNSTESRQEYDRLIGEWMLQGRQTAPRQTSQLRGDRTISELMVAYVHFADEYYRKNGKSTGEYDAIRYSLRPLRRLYGSATVKEFGPLALKNVREEMIKSDLCRNEVNKRIGRIVRMFKWGVENEMVDAMTHHALAQVRGLARGRSQAKETEPVKPVAEDHVEAIKCHVSRQIWAMVELQRLTGMRPGEVCLMRSMDIERLDMIWVYRPASHKTEHHGHERKVYLGPKAQAILETWLKPDGESYLFSPRDELAERSAARREKRKSRIQPSQRKRARKAKPRREPGESYTTHSYYYAIRRACTKAGIPGWHPNQLRHQAATYIRKHYGLDAASLILGHRGVGVTQVYAERDEDKAISVAIRIG